MPPQWLFPDPHLPPLQLERSPVSLSPAVPHTDTKATTATATSPAPVAALLTGRPAAIPEEEIKANKIRLLLLISVISERCYSNQHGLDSQYLRFLPAASSTASCGRGQGHPDSISTGSCPAASVQGFGGWSYLGARARGSALPCGPLANRPAPQPGLAPRHQAKGG